MAFMPGKRQLMPNDPKVSVPSDAMSTGAVSQLLGVNRDTALNWARDDVVPGVYKTAAGHFRIDARVVNVLRGLSERGVRLDARELAPYRAELEQALQQPEQVVSGNGAP